VPPRHAEARAGLDFVAMSDTDVTHELDPANTLGLDYRDEARRFARLGPIWDVHTHLNDVEGARLFFEVAALFGVERVWSMTPLPHARAIQDALGDRVRFIAVPHYANHQNDPETFTTGWMRDIEAFAAMGSKVCKLWAAPRGIDFHESMTLDSPVRREARRLAHSLGMMFMVHVSDPDTWFATKYADAARYGTKAQQYEPLHRMLDEYADVPCIAAHMGGTPENLDFLQELMDRHANLYVDTSATKWMVRELSKHPQRFRAFCEANPGRVMFGTDIVANKDNLDFDLYASRFWALRTLLETTYAGPSPIVDPDLNMVDASVPVTATAALHGAGLSADTLREVYHGAAAKLLG
jgi:hypothetical protein